MASRTPDAFERAMMWFIFVASVFCGCVLWVKQDHHVDEMVFSCWGVSALVALTILFDHYGKGTSKR